MPRFQPEQILRTLDQHGVEYLLIGGLAATLHGSPIRTGDADICPARSTENLRRLAAALVELQARIRTEGVPDGLPFPCDATFLAGVELLNLSTRNGDLDVAFTPSGTAGYDDLLQQRVEFELDGLLVPVAALEDVIRSKEAANREKDRQTLPTLRELLRQSRALAGDD